MCISELLKALCALKINNNYQDMNYSKLVAAIDDRIKANGRREITGQTLHDVLEAMVRSLGAGYQVAGVLGVDDEPGEPDQRFAWLAAEPGVYRNCGGLAVTELSWIIWGGGEWILKPMDVPFGVSVKEWIREAVAEERSRAMIAEALLQEHIDQEAAARAEADTALGGRIDKEIADRETAVAAEADARTKADAALQANIDKEQERAEGAESQLRTDLNTEVAERKQAVADEKARAEKAEQANAAAIAKETEDRAAAVTAEAKARTDADTALGKRVDTETSERKAADTALGGRVDTEVSDRKAAVTAEETARKSADSALDTRVTAIEGKIPATASASNKLADVDFVNSSISTATATFRGTFDTLETLKATEADKNDYAFYVHKDEAGNTCYDKYTYDGAEWKFEYRLNNSSFTAAQWAAINSGITAEVIKALQDADKANSTAITKEIADRKSEDKVLDTVIANVSDSLASEKSQREADDTALGTRIDTEITDRKAADTALQTAIDGKQATLISGTNIKTVNGTSLLGSGDLEIKVGSDPLIVTATWESGGRRTFDKTYAEIDTALKAGQTVLMKDAYNENANDIWVGQLTATEHTLGRGYVGASDNGIVSYRYADALGWYRIEENFIWKSAIDTTIPATPEDTKVPSTKLLKSQIDNLQSQIDQIENPLAKPLTFDILGDGNIIWKCSNASTAKKIQYSKNGGDWTEITSTTDGVAIPVVTGDVLQFKGDNTSYGVYQNSSNYNYFGGTANFSASGNIMSLTKSTGFESVNSISRAAFPHLFYGSTVSDASKLLLPVKILEAECYYYLFSGCTNLTNAPELPATVMANECYQSMFENCTSLQEAPELPAVVLAIQCYQEMFRNTGIKKAPELPATSVMISCYSGMFRDCKQLTEAPELPATELANSCYELMFTDCTTLKKAPTLPATVLTKNCYYGMLRGCTQITSITCLATDISASNCTYEWLKNTSSAGTFTKAAEMTSWPTGISGIPTGWTVKDYTEKEDNSFLVITVTGTTLTQHAFSTDKTAAEIEEALYAGKNIYIDFRDIAAQQNLSTYYAPLSVQIENDPETTKQTLSGFLQHWAYGELSSVRGVITDNLITFTTRP